MKNKTVGAKQLVEFMIVAGMVYEKRFYQTRYARTIFLLGRKYFGERPKQNKIFRYSLSDR